MGFLLATQRLASAMAYVPGFQYDVFISYAVVDNGDPPEGTDGWVDVFAKQLESELQKLTRRKPTVEPWRDTKRIRCGDNFANEIRDAITSSAVMVVLLSRKYLASEWCQREREIFFAALDGQGTSHKRLFVVQLTDPGALDQLPDALADIHHVRLWKEVGGIPKLLGHPVPNLKLPEHQPFFDRILEVAFGIAERLDDFPAVAELPATEAHKTTPAINTADAGPAVYLALAPRSTKEEAFTAELKCALENSVPPVTVVQPTKLPAAGEDPERLIADLQACRLFVQVLGYNSPPRQGLQKKLADAQRLPSLLWKAENVELADLDDEGLKALVQQARLGAVEEAKLAVIEALHELTAPKAPAAAVGRSGESWFINHLPEDRDLALQAFHCLSQHVDDCVKRTLDVSDSEAMREHFEDQLVKFDHVVMVYGRASRLSANEHMRLCFKAVRSRSPASNQIKEWYVVVGPPQPPDAEPGLDVACRGFRLLTIDGRRDWPRSLERSFAQFQPGGQK